METDSRLEMLHSRIRVAISRTGLSLRALSDELAHWAEQNGYVWPGAPEGSERRGAPTHATLSNYQTGHSLPQADLLIALCEIGRTNPAWVLFGAGDIEWDPETTHDAAQKLAARWMRELAGMLDSEAPEIWMDRRAPIPAEPEAREDAS